MRVGLFFGSFDPPHIGHVNVVMGAINSSQVGRVLVIPAYQNLWKESSSKFSYRYAMSCMQFDTLPFVHVSDVEKDLAGPALPYEVIMDEGDCVWVAGCTIQNVDTEVYIEEYSADVENEVSPDEDILENGFSRQVTFYEKD